MTHTGFISHPVYDVEDGRAVVYLYGRLRDGRSFRSRHPYRPYFYVKSEEAGDVPELSDVDIDDTGLTDLDDNPVSRVTLDIPKTVPTIRDSLIEAGVGVYEADVPFTSRFLIDQEVKGTVEIEGDPDDAPEERFDVAFDNPSLTGSSWRPSMDDLVVLSVDIETSPDHDDLYSIAWSTNTGDEGVVVVTGDDVSTGESVDTAAAALERFREAVLSVDPDVVTGWNVIDFDFDVLRGLFDEHDVSFDFGREQGTSSVNVQSAYMRDSSMTVRGRMVIDGIHALRNNFISLDDYKLGTAADAFLDDAKLFSGDDKEGRIREAYEDSPGELAAYNVKDASLVLRILRASNAFDVSLLRSCLTGMPLDRVSATIASFDSLYLGRLHDAGYVAPITDYGQRGDSTTGGHVMESHPGLHDYIVVCDFKSLYPSIMRTFNIDPVSYHKALRDDDDVIEAPNGACFHRERGVLPEILDELTAEKDRATEEEAWVTRSAVKILMNSMYGVLASTNCRFYSEEMANAITGFGHKLLKHTRSVLEKQGYTVIYGDTDSIFIDLDVDSVQEGRRQGEQVAERINQHYQAFLEDEYGVESHIVLEFEKLYKRFFTPPQRGSSGGAKKRYAGLIEDDGEETIDFVGLEYVRRDWTEAAKQLQYELLWRAFHDDDVESFLRGYVDDLRNGEYDDSLVYTKGLSKPPEEYIKTTPQHVKAAKKLDDFNDKSISYVVTVDGPEPVEEQRHSIDYDHYVEKQLKPVAESVLAVLGTNFYDVMQGTKQVDLSSF